jgi:MoaA/NifB/PqqE/SkfB family radical SAM enzyme
MDIDQVEKETGLHDFEGLVKVKNIRGRQMKDGHPFCDVHTHVAQIGVNGDWLLCCVDYARTLSFGNLVNKPIMDIWNDPFFVRMRKELRMGHARIHKCQECPCIKSHEPIRP